MKAKLHVPRLILAILVSVSVVFCLSPLASKLLAVKNVITIRVLECNEYTGGSEVWIASPDKSVDLPGALRMGVWSGNLEYRLASEYGYGYDFLISFGENIGSMLQMETNGALTSEDGFMVYKHPLGGVIEVEYEGEKVRESLYSETPEVVPLRLKAVTWVSFAQKAAAAVLSAGLCVPAYLLLPRLWKREKVPRGLVSRPSMGTPWTVWTSLVHTEPPLSTWLGQWRRFWSYMFTLFSLADITTRS